MRALVLKDLRVLRPWWWIIVPVHVLFSANGIMSPESFFGMNLALAWALTVLLLIVDWKHDADRFVASLPASREDMVRARYAGALGAAVLGTLLYALYGRVLFSLATERLLERWPATPGWESLAGLLTFFLVAWLVSVTYLPFHFRWGLAKGTWAFVGTAAAAVVAVGLLARGRLIALPESGTGTSSTVTVIAALVFAAVAGWVSLRLAVRFYDRRDL